MVPKGSNALYLNRKLMRLIKNETKYPYRQHSLHSDRYTYWHCLQFIGQSEKLNVRPVFNKRDDDCLVKGTFGAHTANSCKAAIRCFSLHSRLCLGHSVHRTDHMGHACHQLPFSVNDGNR